GRTGADGHQLEFESIHRSAGETIDPDSVALLVRPFGSGFDVCVVDGESASVCGGSEQAARRAAVRIGVGYRFALQPSPARVVSEGIAHGFMRAERPHNALRV